MDSQSKIQNSQFSLEQFKKSNEQMIGTNDRAYSKLYGTQNTTRLRAYTAEQVEDILNRGTPDQKRELSYIFFLTNGFYRRINIYYATLLKYQGIMIPNVAPGHKITDPSLEKRYYKALDFVEKINVPNLATDIALKALINGTYYGVITTLDKNNFAILDLPFKYCISRYKDINNNDVIEFDLSYFDSITDELARKSALAAYPLEIAKAYRKYNRNKRQELQYYRIPSYMAICFPFYDGSPFFLSTIPKVVNYQDYEELEKQKDMDEVRKILIQTIPHLNDGTLLFQPPEVEEIHHAAVGMMKKNKNMSVLTTYANVDVASSSSSSDSNKYNNLDKIAETIYRNAGVSAEVFAATGNTALSLSTANDTAMMMCFARKFSDLVSYMTNRLFGNNMISFKYQILPITWYNEKDFIDNAYKEATLGYSYLLPAIAMGLTQKDLIGIKDLENELLQLHDKLVPLRTSYTGGGETGDEGGRPTLDDNKKNDKTIQNEQAAQ